jgi:hypothetical protein
VSFSHLESINESKHTMFVFLSLVYFTLTWWSLFFWNDMISLFFVVE